MASPRQEGPNKGHQNFIPAAVRKAAEEAERLHKETYQPEEPPKEATPEGNPPAERRPEATNPEPPRERQEAQPPQSAPEEPPAQEPAPEPPKGQEQPDYKHLFESEQGRTRKLRQDLSAQSDEIGQLRRLIGTMQSAQPTPPPSSAELPNVDIKTLLSAEEQQEWGEVLPVIEKVARGMVAPLQQQLADRINQVDSKVTSVREHAVVSDRQRMIASLDDPNNPINKSNRQWGEHGGATWRDINTDEEFVGWLQYVDPMSGQKRHDMLKSAFDANDASRVAAFFASFLRETAAVAPPPTAQPSAAPNGSAPSLEQFAAPGRARAGAPASGASSQPEMITTGDISHFFATKTAGRWKGREADADAFERKIFQAENSGNVRAGPLQHPSLTSKR